MHYNALKRFCLKIGNSRNLFSMIFFYENSYDSKIKTFLNLFIFFFIDWVIVNKQENKKKV